MSGNANREPRGVVELLNLNLQGEFPRQVGPLVSPVLEMADWYLAGLGLTAIRATTNFNAPAQVLEIAVPSGETWAIRGSSFQALNLDANAIFSSAIALVDAQGFEMVIAPGVAQTVLSAQNYQIGQTFERPVLVGGAFRIRATANLLGGVPALGFDARLDVFFHRLSLS